MQKNSQLGSSFQSIINKIQMLALEKDQRKIVVSQINQMLKLVAQADIQFEVLIGAGKINYSSVHGNNLADGLCYTLDNVKGWGCWHPTNANKSEWIQLSFEQPKQFIGVVIQGRAHSDCWVKKFEVEYSNNGLQWIKVEPLMNILQAELTYQKYSFFGNNDRNTKVTNYFKTPFSARTVRLMPMQFQCHPCLRFDFLTKK